MKIAYYYSVNHIIQDFPSVQRKWDIVFITVWNHIIIQSNVRYPRIIRKDNMLKMVLQEEGETERENHLILYVALIIDYWLPYDYKELQNY